MSHVADSPINRLFDRFFGAFYPYPANKSALRCGRDHPPSGIRETWLAPNVHLATVLPPHAPRSTPDQRGQVVRRPSPAGYYLTPTPELAKTERDPISTSGPSLFSMSQNRAIPSDKSNICRNSPKQSGMVFPELSNRGVNSQVIKSGFSSLHLFRINLTFRSMVRTA